MQAPAVHNMASDEAQEAAATQGVIWVDLREAAASEAALAPDVTVILTPLGTFHQRSPIYKTYDTGWRQNDFSVHA